MYTYIRLTDESEPIDWLCNNSWAIWRLLQCSCGSKFYTQLLNSGLMNQLGVETQTIWWLLRHLVASSHDISIGMRSTRASPLLERASGSLVSSRLSFFFMSTYHSSKKFSLNFKKPCRIGAVGEESEGCYGEFEEGVYRSCGGLGVGAFYNVWWFVESW